MQTEPTPQLCSACGTHREPRIVAYPMPCPYEWRVLCGNPRCDAATGLRRTRREAVKRWNSMQNLPEHTPNLPEGRKKNDE